MAKKYLLGAFLSLFISSLSFLSYSQNIGVDYFNTGEYEIAKSIFEKQLTQNPAEANFFLGEIAYEKGDFSTAKSHYEQGVAASPDYPFNYIGLGKLLLKTDEKSAENQFSTALKKNKKEIGVVLAIAKAYHKNGMRDKFRSKVEDARKIDGKSPLLFLFEGDALKDDGDNSKIGDAAGMYTQATIFAPDYIIPYIKIAQIYERVNPATAVENLNKVLEINPQYKLAYKYLGNIYYKSGQYAKAIEAYKTFFADNEYSMEDLTHYAASLYFSKNYDEAKKMIEDGISKDPDNFVLNRLLMYSAVESEDYANGLKIAEKFFSLNKDKSDYISRDYMAYAELLSKNDQLDKAIEQYNLAIKLDSKQFAIYKEIGENLAKADRTAEAAEYFRKYIDLAGEEVIALDFFNMGRYYYMTAQGLMQDAENEESQKKAKQNLMQADSAFVIVSERVPDSHLGVMWRARANSHLDNMEAKVTQKIPGYAKPYYERMTEIILGKEGNNNQKELSEAYNYLLSYYYFKYTDSKSVEDKAQIVKYAENLLSIDPENAQAKNIIDAVNQ